jgi:5-methyltetrahydropteroyltriglutamate--homocysteine methyltransferase
MWLDCITDRAYETREALAADVVRALREEVHFLLAQGAAWVQLDEPVLTEVVFSGPKNRRSFMCGALSERLDVEEELDLAARLINAVVEGLPRSRTAIHVCRGNWTQDESLVLAGDYRPLMPLLKRLDVGAYLLELCTPRAGEMEVLRGLPEDRRIGIGLINPKSPSVEPVEEIVRKGRRAIELFGADRVVMHPDCGFATFADNPVASARVAEDKLRTLVRAAQILRGAASR